VLEVVDYQKHTPLAQVGLEGLETKNFSLEIVVIKGEKEANAKSSLKLMTLCAKKGNVILIRAEGDDAEKAVDALVELISADEH
jgi:phosphocarrier protein HPr